MAGAVGSVTSLNVAPTPCTSCKMPSKDCLSRLIRTTKMGRRDGRLDGRGLACCNSCRDGNTHPMPDDKPCAEWAVLHGGATRPK